MPILTAKDSLGQLLRPGDRVAVPTNPDASPEEMIWIGGALLGFDPWKYPHVARVLALFLRRRRQRRPAGRLCRRLGSRHEMPV